MNNDADRPFPHVGDVAFISGDRPHALVDRVVRLARGDTGRPFEPLLAIRGRERAVPGDGEDASGDPHAVGDCRGEQGSRGGLLVRAPRDAEQPVDSVRCGDHPEGDVGAGSSAAANGRPEHPDAVILDDEAELNGAGRADRQLHRPGAGDDVALIAEDDDLALLLETPQNDGVTVAADVGACGVGERDRSIAERCNPAGETLGRRLHAEQRGKDGQHRYEAWGHAVTSH